MQQGSPIPLHSGEGLKSTLGLGKNTRERLKHTLSQNKIKANETPLNKHVFCSRQMHQRMAKEACYPSLNVKTRHLQRKVIGFLRTVTKLDATEISINNYSGYPSSKIKLMTTTDHQ